MTPQLAPEALSRLSEPFRSALASMYAKSPQLGSDGVRYNLDGRTSISLAEGLWLYDLCRKQKPEAVLEIGLAYGFSTLYFLAALHENGTGRHTAIDPFQAHWHGIGETQPRNVGMESRFSLVAEKSAPALIHFADRGESFDLIFIDGNHRFDDVVVDFTLAAEVCPVGGHIVLDDMWMPSIQSAAAFIRMNRTDFTELPTPVENIAAFRKIAEDDRPWDFHVEFNADPLAQTLRRLPRPIRAALRLFLRMLR